MEAIEVAFMTESKKQNIIQTVKDYGSLLFRFIRSKVSTDEDAEDILQDVWYQYAHTSATQVIEQASGWLFSVARNKITDRYRKQKPILIGDSSFENEDGEQVFKEILFAADTHPETEDIKKLFWKELIEALEELPENQQQVYMWNELEDMTLQQIADKTGENIKTIISRKRYAVKHLRQRLQYLYDQLFNY